MIEVKAVGVDHTFFLSRCQIRGVDADPCGCGVCTGEIKP